MNEEIFNDEQIEKIGRDTYQPIVNILVESPFFYASDDPVRFNGLRRNKSAFEKFFQKFFGWRLYVDSKMARLIKDGSYNPALRNANRRFFNLTSRLECILFLLLLEFYEHESDDQGYSYDESENLLFKFGDFFDFSRNNLADRLADKAPSERELDTVSRQLFKKLQDYRLICIKETDLSNDAGDFPEMLVEVLPGLNCYEGGKMAESVSKKAFGIDEEDFANVAEADEYTSEEPEL